MAPWLQYFGAFATGSGGAGLIGLMTQQRRISAREKLASRRDETLDQQQLFYEASEMLSEMRREIDRLRREVVAVRTECESRQSAIKTELEIMRREVNYWQQVAGELRRDTVQLKAEIERLLHRVNALENAGDQSHQTVIG